MNIFKRVYYSAIDHTIGIIAYIFNFIGITQNNHQVYSFIIDENEKIKVLDINCILCTEEVTNKIDVNNVENYLNHHYIDNTISFTATEYDRPIIVQFKYNNNIYKICLDKLKTLAKDQTTITREPMILSATIRTKFSKKCSSITKEIVKFHGPDRNFFKHIPDAITDLNVIFGNNIIYIFDSLGRKRTVC